MEIDVLAHDHCVLRNARRKMPTTDNDSREMYQGSISLDTSKYKGIVMLANIRGNGSAMAKLRIKLLLLTELIGIDPRDRSHAGYFSKDSAALPKTDRQREGWIQTSSDVTKQLLKQQATLSRRQEDVAPSRHCTKQTLQQRKINLPAARLGVLSSSEVHRQG